MTARTATPQTPCDPDLGVLVVQGIGAQPRGKTLIRWTDALSAYHSMLAGPDSVRIGVTRINPIEDEPPSTELRLDVRGQPEHWLLTEAWWQGEAIPPSYGELVTWSLKILPNAILAHVAGAVARTKRRLDDGPKVVIAYHVVVLMLWVSVGLPALLLLAPVAAALSLLLLVVGLIPLNMVRTAVGRMQRLITGAVGDSMILLDSPTQAAAMMSRVVDGVDHLRSRNCARVAILAHSQGGALAKMALAELPELRVDGLVTVGSGINKLDGLRRSPQKWWTTWSPLGYLTLAAATSLSVIDAIRHDRLPSWTVLGLSLLTLLVAGAAVVIGIWLQDRGGPWAVVGIILTMGAGPVAGAVTPGEVLLVAALVILVGTFAFVVARELRKGTPTVDPPLVGSVRQWLDIYTHCDPVPNGQTRTEQPNWPASVTVRNLDSMVGDHRRYTSAIDDAVATVGEFLTSLRHDGQEFRRSDRLREDAGRRRWRVKYLRAARWATTIGASAFIALTWPTLHVAGELVYTPLAKHVPGLHALLPDTLPESLLTLCGAACAALVGTLVYYVGFTIWNVWDAYVTRCAESRGDERKFEVLLSGVVVAMVVAGLTLPLFLPGLESYLDPTLRSGALGSPWWWLICSVVGAAVMPSALELFGIKRVFTTAPSS